MATQEERPQTKHAALVLVQQIIFVFEASFVEGFYTTRCTRRRASCCGGAWRAGCIRRWLRSAWRVCGL